MAKTKHYVNNADFLEALIKYRADIKIAEENEEEKPPLPDYIGECFLLIAQRLSFRPTQKLDPFSKTIIQDKVKKILKK